MGDRALVTVKSYNDYSETFLYSHWKGYVTIDELIKAIPKMRQNDAQYSQARLISHFCELDPDTNCGVGAFGYIKPEKIEDFKEMADGDFGVCIYDCSTGMIQCFGGYGVDDPRNNTSIGIPPK